MFGDGPIINIYTYFVFILIATTLVWYQPLFWLHWNQKSFVTGLAMAR